MWNSTLLRSIEEEDVASVCSDDDYMDNISLSSLDVERALSVTSSIVSTTTIIDTNDESVTQCNRHISKEGSPDKTVTELLPSRTANHYAEYLKRRLDNFHHARLSRHNQNGISRCWDILCLFDHLTEVRFDLKWAEEAAYCQVMNLPYPSCLDYHRDDQYRKMPIVTNVMLLVVVITMIYSLYLNGWHVAPLQENPMLGPSAQVLLDVGAMQTSRMILYGEWYRIITAIFLRAGLFHLAVNAIALYFVGNLLERVHGPIPTYGLYLLSAIGANVASALFSDPNIISLGASGGVFSLLGVCVADCWNYCDLIAYDNKICRFPFLSCYTMVIIECIFNFSMGFTVFVDNFCHIGGFVYGVCFGLPLLDHLILDPQSQWRRGYSFFWKTFAFALALTLLVTTSVFLLSSDPQVGRPPNVCSWCRYISCLPTKWWKCDECTTISATIHHTMKVLELKCPRGFPVMISLSDTVDYEMLEHKLSDYCRNYCSH